MKTDLESILTKSHKSWGKRILQKDALGRLNADYAKRMNSLSRNFQV